MPAEPPSSDWPALYAAGATLAEISAGTGFPIKHIREHLAAAGVVIRSAGPRRGHTHTDWHETAAAMRAAGYGYAAIGRALGHATGTVRIALLRRAAAVVEPSAGYPVEPMDGYWP